VVIGVVGDVRISPYFARPVSRFQIYRSLAQYPSGAYGILLRSPRSPGDLSKSVREAIARINPDISLSELGGVADSIRSKVDDASSEKIVSLGAFALVGLLEAMVGLYGVISQLTVQRTREIGIRVALGAGYSSVVRLIMAQGARVVSCGLALGIVGAYGVMTFYHATEPELPLPGAGFQLDVALLLGAAALAACFLPARRAGKVDPLVALRAE
jgi:ABC-type antimicrobial peptide transport system permease subunit